MTARNVFISKLLTKPGLISITQIKGNSGDLAKLLLSSEKMLAV